MLCKFKGQCIAIKEILLLDNMHNSQPLVEFRILKVVFLCFSISCFVCINTVDFDLHHFGTITQHALIYIHIHITVDHLYNTYITNELKIVLVSEVE